MKFDPKKPQIEFENMRNVIKTKIYSYIKNEYHEYFNNVENCNVSPKINEISNSVMLNLQNWMHEKIPEKYKEIVLKYIREEKWSEIVEAFKQEIVFGTSGIRGKLIVSLDKENSERDLQSLNEYGFESTILRGCNSINEITIIKNICGLLNYMNKKNMSKIIIGHDSRILGKLFSHLIASIFLKNGYSVVLFDQDITLPELSFSVTAYDADMGIEITASHNDKRYNGYKLITKSGAPPPAEIREEITREIFNNKQNIPYELLSINSQNKIFDSNLKNFLIIKKFQSNDYLIDEYDKLHEQYLNQITSLIFNKNIIKNYSSKISMGYSALHGTGYFSTAKLLRKLGVTNVKYISTMIHPDSLFPLFNSKQILDPSDIDAANVVVNAFNNQYGSHAFDDLDVLCYTDPDADRLGIIIRVPYIEQSIYGKWKLLKANDVWTLFLWYFLEHITKNSFLNLSDLFIVKSFVTSDSLLYISKKYNMECIDGQEGFSDLTALVSKKWQENKINIGMFEESCGFGMAGNLDTPFTKLHILEKDGMLSLAFIVEILSYAKSQNLSLLELLDKIYLDIDVGFFVTYRRELPEKDIFEGIKGEFHLIQILKNVENFCIKANEKIKDNEPIMICNLPISDIKKYSTGKYDVKFWKNFPDEGIRFFLGSKTNHITIRSSGTEPKLRIFVQYRINDLNQNNILEKKLYAEDLVKKLTDKIETMITLTKL